MAIPDHWRGDRDRDQVLLKKLMLELEKMAEKIQSCLLDEPLEKNVSDEVKHILIRL